MQKKNTKLKIKYELNNKILSLRFNTIRDFVNTNFPKGNNRMSPRNDTIIISVTWDNQKLYEKDISLYEVKLLLKGFDTTGLIRKEIYSVEEVRDKVKNVLFEDNKYLSKVEFDGDLVKGNSQRYQTFFTKGCKCVKCVIEGKYFAKEKHFKDRSYHLNLYAIDDNGNEVLMTKDHIIPQSKGGSDDISNYQTMCEPCNKAKGSKIED